MALQVPDEALGAAVGVLIYSIVCLCCSLCLLHLSWVHGDRFGCESAPQLAGSICQRYLTNLERGKMSLCSRRLPVSVL